MKFFVWKKACIAHISIMVLGPVILISLLILAQIIGQMSFSVIFSFENILGALILISPIFSVHISAFFTLPKYGSVIAFEDNAVKRILFKKTKQVMPYNEIKDYGFFDRKIRSRYGISSPTGFIYISKIERSEIQNGHRDLFALYSHSKDSLILEYHDEVIEFLKMKCPDIIPYEGTKV